MHRTVVINAVALTPSLIGEDTPRLKAFAAAGKVVPITPPLPAVTCASQATFLTGKLPREHGIVGNGWYFRDECEIRFWRQSNKLVQAEKVWEIARKIDPNFTCANLFWWFAMYSTADYTVTARPMYTADGRKIPDIWTNPPGLRRSLQDELGQFPLFEFWGPATSIRSTKWIVDAALRVDEQFSPTLSLVYLPHLDYGLQKSGPGAPEIAAELRLLDEQCGRLIDHFSRAGARVIVVSEYGITSVLRQAHLNRELRQRGLLVVRDERGHELLDAGASAAFAVADHQVAHVYVNDRSKLEEVRRVIESTAGVARVYDEATRGEIGLDHPRSGELIALAEPDAWFTYYYWLDDARAPDFARTVDIHRKPGYDPVELFSDASRAQVGWKLLKRKLGLRALLDVIPLDATLVKGSHGLQPRTADVGPMLIAGPDLPLRLPQAPLPATDVLDVILQSLGS